MAARGIAEHVVERGVRRRHRVGHTNSDAIDNGALERDRGGVELDLFTDPVLECLSVHLLMQLVTFSNRPFLTLLKVMSGLLSLSWPIFS